MKLKDLKTEEEIEEALAAGDKELIAEIDAKVAEAIKVSLDTAEPNFYGREDLIMAALQRVGVASDIASEMQDRYPTLTSEISTQTIVDALEGQLEEAASGYAENLDSWGSKLMQLMAADWGHAETEGWTWLAWAPVTLDISTEGELEMVPLKHLGSVLDSEEPIDAYWSPTGMDSWTSTILDHPTRGLYVRTDPDEYQEWLTDLRTQVYSDLVDADPKLAISELLRILKAQYPALLKKVKKAKLPEEVLADYAVTYFEDPDEGIVLIREAMGVWEYEGSRGQPLLEIDKAVLTSLGITSGKFWDGAPWTLLNLPPEELAYEGTLQRHCVGRHDMGYREAVESGQTQVWSLRSKFNKPLLTFEIDYGIWELARNPQERAASLIQLKGKLNRLAGESHEESAVIYWIFDQLDIDDTMVDDFRPRVAAANPGRAPRRTFDQPCAAGRASAAESSADGPPKSELQGYQALKRKLMR